MSRLPIAHMITLLAHAIVVLAPPTASVGQSKVMTSVPSGDLFGLAIHSYPDINGDGISDIAVCDPIDVEGKERSRIIILSGRDGAVLRTYSVGKLGQIWGYRMTTLSDLDSDGKPDFLVIVRESFGSSHSFAVAVGSKSGGELYSIGLDLAFPSTFGENFLQLEGEADLNGDSVLDFVVGSQRDGPPPKSMIRSYSGRDGTALWTIEPIEGQASVCESLAVVQDCNGDGVKDLLATQRNQDQSVSLAVRSGRSGAVIKARPLDFNPAHLSTRIRTTRLTRCGGRSACPGVVISSCGVPGGESRVELYRLEDLTLSCAWRSSSETFGIDLAEVCDLKKGTSRLVASEPGHYSDKARLTVLDEEAKSSEEMFGISEWESSGFGQALQCSADLDGDGVSDIVVGEASLRARGGVPGHVWALSGCKRGIVLWKCSRP